MEYDARNTFYEEEDIQFAAALWYGDLTDDSLNKAENRLHRGESFDIDKAKKVMPQVFKKAVFG